MTEITKIAVYLNCGTCNTILAHSSHTTVKTNVKMAIQKVGKDLEQNLVGYFLNLKLIVEFYTVLKGKIHHQYHDIHDIK